MNDFGLEFIWRFVNYYFNLDLFILNLSLIELWSVIGKLFVILILYFCEF